MHTFLKVCLYAVDRKLSKLAHACRNYSLPKLARFFLRYSVVNKFKHLLLVSHNRLHNASTIRQPPPL